MWTLAYNVTMFVKITTKTFNQSILSHAVEKGLKFASRIIVSGPWTLCWTIHVPLLFWSGDSLHINNFQIEFKRKRALNRPLNSKFMDNLEFDYNSIFGVANASLRINFAHMEGIDLNVRFRFTLKNIYFLRWSSFGPDLFFLTLNYFF